MAVKKKTLTKVKKKWFQIIAPSIFNRRIIGESHVSDVNKLVGRTVDDNLMNITNNIKNKNVYVKFEITGIKDDKAATDIVGYSLSPSSVKRFVRPGKDRVDYSFVCKSLDGKPLRVKIFLLTIAKANASVLTSLRKEAEKFLTAKISKMKSDDFFKEVVDYKAQLELRSALKKTYPIKNAEIRMLQVVKGKKVSSAKVVQLEKKEESKKEKPKKAVKKEEPKEEPEKEG